MAIMIIASKISHWPVFLYISERQITTPVLYMNILKIKQYKQSSNQNLIMTRGQFNKSFTSIAKLLFYSLKNNSYTCK